MIDNHADNSGENAIDCRLEERLLVVGNVSIPTDKEGYLCHLDDWSRAVAETIARREGIELTPSHWEVIDCLRDFYCEYHLSPAMRPLVRYLAHRLGKDKGQSLYLLSLFPGSPAKLASKIAGLPRPANCL